MQKATCGGPPRFVLASGRVLAVEASPAGLIPASSRRVAPWDHGGTQLLPADSVCAITAHLCARLPPLALKVFCA